MSPHTHRTLIHSLPLFTFALHHCLPRCSNLLLDLEYSSLADGATSTLGTFRLAELTKSRVSMVIKASKRPWNGLKCHHVDGGWVLSVHEEVGVV